MGKLECVYSSASSATEALGMRLRGEITQFAMDNDVKQREEHMRFQNKLEELGKRLGQLATEHETELETVGLLFEGLEQRLDASLLQVSSAMGSTVQASLRSFRSKLGEDLVRALGEVETRHKDLFHQFLAESEPKLREPAPIRRNLDTGSRCGKARDSTEIDGSAFGCGGEHLHRPRRAPGKFRQLAERHSGLDGRSSTTLRNFCHPGFQQQQAHVLHVHTHDGAC